MIVRAKLIKPVSKLDSLIRENNELISIFVTSIRTAKKVKKNSHNLALGSNQPNFLYF